MKVEKTGMPNISDSGQSQRSAPKKIEDQKLVDAGITHKVSPDQFEKVLISSKAKDAAKAKALAQNAPDVRESKVAELKAKIADGTYKFNPDAVADKLVDDHLTGMRK